MERVMVDTSNLERVRIKVRMILKFGTPPIAETGNSRRFKFDT